MFTKEFIELGRIAAESAIETLITKAKNETGAEISFNEMLQMTKTDANVGAMYQELMMKGLQMMTGVAP